VGRIFLLVIVALVAGLAIPSTRPRILEKAAPMLYPLHKWQTTGEMEQISREISSYERTYFKLPTSRNTFNKWLHRNFVDETARDTWGNAYTLRVWPDSFALYSAGPDLERDTEDDIRFLKLRAGAVRELTQGR
jgi:hypothetical protein